MASRVEHDLQVVAPLGFAGSHPLNVKQIRLSFVTRYGLFIAVC